jgi:RNA polymerase sigma-70 factor (ECF subfamily)
VLDIESFVAQLKDCYQRCWLIAAAVTGDRVEADDIVQEAALVALQKRSEFTPGTSFGAWMAQIVRLTALNHLKKQNRRNTVVSDPTKMDQIESSQTMSSQAMSSPNEPSSNELFGFTQDGRLVAHQTAFDDEIRRALLSVGDVPRQCLLLRVVKQLSYDEIAETLKIPSGTVMSHVHRAKQSIREHLKSQSKRLANQ